MVAAVALVVVTATFARLVHICLACAIRTERPRECMSGERVKAGSCTGLNCACCCTALHRYNRCIRRLISALRWAVTAPIGTLTVDALVLLSLVQTFCVMRLDRGNVVR